MHLPAAFIACRRFQRSVALMFCCHAGSLPLPAGSPSLPAALFYPLPVQPAAPRGDWRGGRHGRGQELHAQRAAWRGGGAWLVVAMFIHTRRGVICTGCVQERHAQRAAGGGGRWAGEARHMPTAAAVMVWSAMRRACPGPVPHDPAVSLQGLIACRAVTRQPPPTAACRCCPRTACAPAPPAWWR